MTRAGAFETFVGFIVVAIAAAFLFYAYGVTGNKIGADQYRLGAVFGSIDGITVGSEVRIAGVKIGSVVEQNLELENYEAEVKIVINKNIPLSEDTSAKIVSDGILGGAYISIEPGGSEELLIDGDKITITQGAVDLLGLAVQNFTQNQNGNDDSDDADPLGDL